MFALAHRARRCLVLLAGLGLALPIAQGCQQIGWAQEDDNDDDDWQPPGPTWPPDVGEDTAPGDGDGDEGGTKLDSPPPDSLTKCSVVDLLFVIDNSDSMSAEQANLIASFDGFIAGIQANLDEANDYHVGVVTTDAYALNAEGCRELGALVTHSAAGPCGPWTAGNFITLADELAPAFTCAATIGGGGDIDEHQIEAALRAIGPDHAGPAGCNEGFIRDDALLVIVLITDEDDGALASQGTPGNPSQWFSEVVGLKGVESNVVVLALAGQPQPNACEIGVPLEGAEIAWRIRDFVQRFSYGRLGDVCADDYVAFFDDALELIHDACDNFTPEG